MCIVLIGQCRASLGKPRQCSHGVVVIAVAANHDADIRQWYVEQQSPAARKGTNFDGDGAKRLMISELWTHKLASDFRSITGWAPANWLLSVASSRLAAPGSLLPSVESPLLRLVRKHSAQIAPGGRSPNGPSSSQDQPKKRPATATGWPCAQLISREHSNLESPSQQLLTNFLSPGTR